MKTVALLSGGKDSILSVMIAMRYGHTPVVIANMTPAASTADETNVHEVDSYMFQTVGHEVMEAIARCMQLPLRRSQVRRGQAKEQGLSYVERPLGDDEVEELYRLLKAVMEEFPEVKGVTTGAILSNYQRNRVERVCARLGLVSLAYLWQRPAEEVLDMVTALGMRAILVKTASVGLNPRKLLGKTLEEARPVLQQMETLYGSHMAGEGGEFETIVLDCPLYTKECLAVRHMEVVMVDKNDYSPSGHCVLGVTVEAKSEAQKERDAAILSKLMDRSDSGFCFPSDTMRALPSPRVLTGDDALKGTRDVAIAANVFTAVEAFLKERDATFVTRSLTAAEEADAVDGFRDTKEWLHREGLELLSVFIVCQRSAWEARVSALYDALAPVINPPTLSCTFAVEGDPSVFLGVVATRRACASATQTLHAQSLTCWAAGLPGATHSQAWAAEAPPLGESASRDIARCVACCGVQGVDPATGVLVGKGPACSTLADADPQTQRFVAQFAFAYASVAAYARFYSQPSLASTEPGTHLCVVCVVVRPSDVARVPLLWRWCTGDAGDAPAFLSCVVSFSLRNEALVELNVISCKVIPPEDDE